MGIEDYEPVREVVCADCLEHMRTMPDACVDAVITDPPYGLGFMGAEWDTFAGSRGRETVEERKAKSEEYRASHKSSPGFGNSHGKTPTLSEMLMFQRSMIPVFEEALRVSKPGAHLLCFGGARTFHRLACAIEEAGWEIRDCLVWMYGSGFPKGLDVSKAIDKMKGAERAKVVTTGGLVRNANLTDDNWSKIGDGNALMDSPEPATAAAAAWLGWNTQLKPAWEPIILARKPLEGSVAANVLRHGTGALNIGACRIGDERIVTCGGDKFPGVYGDFKTCEESEHEGRYPANLVHDGSEEALACFPDSNLGKSRTRVKHKSPRDANTYGEFPDEAGRETLRHGGNGSAARFFYCAKASAKERGQGNDHPTVKPLALMEWLVKLVTAEDALILDPFAGSGTTLLAAQRLGREFIGIEKEPKYAQIIERRLADAAR